MPADLRPVAVFMGCLLAGGCAAPCEKVRQRESALRHPQAAQRTGPQMVVSVPLTTLNHLLSRPVAKLRPVALPIPDVGLPQLPGLSLGLGNMRIHVQQIAVVPAPDGLLGIDIALGLSSGRKQVTSLHLQTQVRPQIDPQGGKIRVAVGAGDIAKLKPTLAPSERTRLANFLWSQVPSSLHRLVSRSRVEQAANTMIDNLLGRSFEGVRRNLLGNIHRYLEFSFDLPHVPVSSVRLRSGKSGEVAALMLDVQSPLAAAAVTAPGARLTGQSPHQVQVQMSGSMVAALANRAMDEGQIPARYTRSGAPSPHGEFTAGLTWVPGPKPLKLHAFKTDRDCVHIQFAATPKLSISGADVVVAVDDAKIERSTGSAKVRAALWFSGIGRQTFSFSESLAAGFSLDLPGAPVKAQVVAADVRGDDVIFGLNLR